MSHHQAKLAVESRAYPLFRYDPDGGDTVAECLDLDGNPAMSLDWPVTKIRYVEQEREKEMDLSTTFVDFAVTETRFRKHFRKIPRDAWHEEMMQVSDYLELDEDDREDKVPYVWSLDARQQLSRLLVAEPMIKSAEDRRAFWAMLRDLASLEEEPVIDESQVESRIRQEVVQKIASGLMGLVSGNQAMDMDAVLGSVAASSAGGPRRKGRIYGEKNSKGKGNTNRLPLPPGVDGGGHGGSHGYLMSEFVDAVLRDRKPWVDVAQALNMTVAGIVAHQSALKDGELLKIPQYVP